MSQSNGLHGQLLSAQSPGMADFIPPATDLDTGDTGESGGGIKAASMHYSPVVNADNTRQHAPSWGPETVPDQTPGAGPSSCDLNTAIDLLRGEVIVPNADNASGFSPVSPENSSKLASQSNTLKSNNVPSLPGQFTSVFICSVSGSQENSAVDPLLDLWATRATELKVSQTVLQIVIRRFLGEAYLPELQGFDYLISAERKKSLLIGCDLYPARDDGGPTRNLTDSEKALCFAALGVLSLSAESLGNIGYNAPLIQECFKYLNPAAEQYSNGQIRDRILPLAMSEYLFPYQKLILTTLQCHASDGAL
ncbi:hypothetical protein SISSUDRAFT_755230 [Sistotremastrum suecicum HHB10207 ss-3]|uniref:Uncharacterized protein n=1 Tax=Sistotremastrum suecicum HHB10207 ss-3 TaxID=1314776 RepID=A0A166DF45_9AGAM|nr:hypothetical protein SISSUDRAFT_755230 [Sistotremastrum suecicum HHB10207 ss-3]